MSRLGFLFGVAVCQGFALSPLEAVRMNDFEDFSLYGVDGFTTGLRNQVQGGSIGSNQSLSFASDFRIDKSIYSGGGVYFGNWGHNVGGKVYHKGPITYESWVTPQYSTIPEQSIAAWTSRKIPTKAVPYGTQDFILPQVSDITILPGSYRDLRDDGNSDIRLKSGEYNFRTFITEDATRLHLDVTSGPISINVEGKIQIGDMLSMKLTPSIKPLSIRWYSNTDTTILSGHDVKIFGVFTAPKAEFKLEHRSVLVGAIHAKKVTMVDDSKACSPPTLRDLYHSSVAMGPFFNPWTSSYKAVVPTNTENVQMEALADNGVAVTYNPQSLNPTDIDQVLKVILTDPARESFIQGCGTSEYTISVREDFKSQVFVKSDATCGSSCDGESWSSAFPTLDKGIEKVQASGKEIWVGKGSYWTNSLISNQDGGIKGFSFTSGAKIRGGFNGTEDNLEKRVGPVYEVKILAMDPAVNPGDPDAPPPADHVFYFEGGNPFVEMMAIQGGKADGSGSNSDGGGILAVNSRLTMDYLWLNGNSANRDGGGIQVRSTLASPPQSSLSNSYITNNLASNGSGGGIGLAGIDFKMVGGVVASNNSKNGGGISSISGGSISVNFSTLINNAASSSGGGVYSTGIGKIDNSIIWNNSSGIQGTGVVIANSDIQGGMINIDPKFVLQSNALGPDQVPFTSDDGSQLSPLSPLIDKGQCQLESQSPDCLGIQSDIFRMPRIQDGNGDGTSLSDLGAYEYFEEIKTGVIGLFFINDGGRFQPILDVPMTTGVETGEQVTIISKSLSALTLRPKIPKHSKLRDRFYTKINMVDASGSVLGRGVTIYFYRVGEEAGSYIYQSQRLNGIVHDGKPIIIVDNPTLEGERPDAFVLYGVVGSHFRSVTTMDQF